MDAHERKVRKVYDAIRAKNWKGAIKMVETALHKFNNSAVLRSLKAFSLEKLGKLDQAFELCEEIRSTGTIDEQVLHTLGMVYKTMDRMDCLTSAYLAAVEQKGNDLELLQGLFSCYVRECAFAKQQQLAMKMYKASSQSDKYLWWVIVSILLQVWNRPGIENTPPPLGVDKTLKLAQSLIQKQLQTNKVISSLEGVFLYIDILYRQGNAPQVLEWLNTDLSIVCMRPVQLKVLKAQCTVALGDFKEASNHLREILSIEPDFWIGICALLELYLPIEERVRTGYPSWCDLIQESCQLIINHKHSFNGYSSDSCINAEEAGKAFQFVQSTLNEKIEEAPGSSPSLVRCLALLEVEYNFRKLKCGLSDESELQNSIIHAFETMGHLSSVANDLDVYIKLLKNQDSLYEALEDRRKQLKEGDSSLVNLMQILSSLDTVWEPKQIQQFVIEALKNSEMDNAITSALNVKLMQPSNNSTFHELGTSVWEAFLIIGIASLTPSRAPSIYLAHSALAFLLGAPKKGLEIFEAMEIKHTQLDSIASHFWYPFMRSYHCQEALRKFTLDANVLFTTQKSDVEETTFTAYQEGTYTKILEFVSFKERLEMSHTFHMLKCDQSLSQILSSIRDGLQSVELSLAEACDELDLEKLNGNYFERLIFNEDVGCRPRWLPLFYGDLRFATIEWWAQFQSNSNSTQNDNFEKWKQSRISFLKRCWCIPHLLKRLWLINQGPIENKEPSSTLVVFFNEAEVPRENALICLKDRLAAWESSQSRMLDLQSIYLDFQCSILYLSHLAPCVFMESSDGSSTIEEFQQWTELICELSQKLISISFNKLETDLSCWVKTAGVLLGAMLYTEVPLIITSLAFWDRYYHQQKLQNPELWKIMISFTSSMKSLLEMIIQYLSLVDDMDIERVTKNLMVLLGMMEEKSETHTFQCEIKGKDIDALSIYMEQLNLEDFGLCKEWALWPRIELHKIEGLLQEASKENKEWGQKLLKVAQDHLSQLLKLSTFE